MIEKRAENSAFFFSNSFFYNLSSIENIERKKKGSNKVSYVCKFYIQITFDRFYDPKSWLWKNNIVVKSTRFLLRSAESYVYSLRLSLVWWKSVTKTNISIIHFKCYGVCHLLDKSLPELRTKIHWYKYTFNRNSVRCYIQPDHTVVQ